MTALSSTFTSYLSYISSFFISSTFAATNDTSTTTAAVVAAKTAVATSDPSSSAIVGFLLVFFDQADVIVQNGAIYLHGVLLTQVLTCAIAVLSFLMIILKGGVDLILMVKKWRLDKLEREMSELNDD